MGFTVARGKIVENDAVMVVERLVGGPFRERVRVGEDDDRPRPESVRNLVHFMFIDIF